MRLFFKFIFCIFLFSACGVSKHNAQSNSSIEYSKIYSWRKNKTIPDVVPFIWINKKSIKNLDNIVARLKKRAPGKRILFLQNGILQELWTTPKDKLSDGRNSIWWDNGTSKLEKKIENLFRYLYQNKAIVDLVILDIETGFSNWHLNPRNKKSGKNYFKALASDNRINSVFDSLSFKNLNRIEKWVNSTQYLEWNAFMTDRKNEYINQAIFAPITQFYPNVKVSNYGSFYWNKEYKVPEYNGHRIYLYGDGGHVGTHQSQEFYGRLGQVVNKRNLINGAKKSPFFALVYELNKAKSMKLSSEIPIHAWIAQRSFTESLFYNSDFYQELVLHLYLIGVDNFLYWNPPNKEKWKNDESDLILSNVISDYNAITQIFPNNKSLVKPKEIEYINWTSSYILNGYESKDHTIWRLTGKNKNELSTLKKKAKKESKIAIEIDGRIIEINNIENIIENPENPNGVWLIQKKPQ